MTKMESLELPKDHNSNSPVNWDIDFKIATPWVKEEKLSATWPSADSLLPVDSTIGNGVMPPLHNSDISAAASRDKVPVSSPTLVSDADTSAKSVLTSKTGDRGMNGTMQAGQTTDNDATREIGEINKRLQYYWSKNPEGLEFFGDAAHDLLDSKGTLNGLTVSALQELLMARYCAAPGVNQANIDRDLQILKSAGVTEKEIQSILDKASKAGIPNSCAVS